MNFEFSADQQALQNRVVKFCEKFCTAETVDEIEVGNQSADKLYAQFADSGLLSYAIPVDLGGSGGGILDVVIIAEELAKWSGTLVNMYLVNAVFAGLLLQRGGSPSQIQHRISKLQTGKHRLAFALTEPDAGSDASAISTTATKSGDGWEINGKKRYTTGAQDADEILVVARTNADVSPAQGMSVFLVPVPSKGLTITPMDKIAGNSFATCELDLDRVQVSAESILGLEDGFNNAWSTLRIVGGIERICVAAVALGISRIVFDDATAHCKERVQFGQSIGQFQAVSHRLADMATMIEAMRLLIYSAAAKIDKNKDAGKEISMAKAFAAENVNKLVLDGLHLLGGKGFLSESRMTRMQREALLCLYAGGTTEIQKNLICRYLDL